MKHRSKRYKEGLKLVDKSKTYTVKEAVEMILKMPKAKYDETLEISGNLAVDPKQTDQAIRGSVVLPHGTGKILKVIVFCESEKEQDAKAAGADYVGGQDLIDKINSENWMDFDVCIATPGMMRMVSKLGKVLGPRGLMPSPKSGTVTENVAYAVKESKRGKVDFRMDKQACIHIGVGKLSFTKEALVENSQALLDALVASRPASVHGEFIKSLFLSSTVGPSVRISVDQGI
jgi:large subunit ribosomal protein L1